MTAANGSKKAMVPAVSLDLNNVVVLPVDVYRAMLAAIEGGEADRERALTQPDTDQQQVNKEIHRHDQCTFEAIDIAFRYCLGALLKTESVLLITIAAYIAADTESPGVSTGVPVDRLAERLGCDRRTVERALARLKKIGAIVVASGGGRGNHSVYRLGPALDEQSGRLTTHLARWGTEESAASHEHTAPMEFALLQTIGDRRAVASSVLIFLAENCDANGECAMSIREISEAIGIGHSTAERAVSSLRKRGLIESIGCGGQGPNTFRICASTSQGDTSSVSTTRVPVRGAKLPELEPDEAPPLFKVGDRVEIAHEDPAQFGYVVKVRATELMLTRYFVIHDSDGVRVWYPETRLRSAPI